MSGYRIQYGSTNLTGSGQTDNTALKVVQLPVTAVKLRELTLLLNAEGVMVIAVAGSGDERQ
jgi:hypothetical protein